MATTDGKQAELRKEEEGKNLLLLRETRTFYQGLQIPKGRRSTTTLPAIQRLNTIEPSTLDEYIATLHAQYRTEPR